MDFLGLNLCPCDEEPAGSLEPHNFRHYQPEVEGPDFDSSYAKNCSFHVSFSVYTLTFRSVCFRMAKRPPKLRKGSVVQETARAKFGRWDWLIYRRCIALHPNICLLLEFQTHRRGVSYLNHLSAGITFCKFGVTYHTFPEYVHVNERFE